MRWRGHEELLPGPPPPKEKKDSRREIDLSILISRMNRKDDPKKRLAALDELKRRGIVEEM